LNDASEGIKIINNKPYSQLTITTRIFQNDNDDKNNILAMPLKYAHPN